MKSGPSQLTPNSISYPSHQETRQSWFDLLQKSSKRNLFLLDSLQSLVTRQWFVASLSCWLDKIETRRRFHHENECRHKWSWPFDDCGFYAWSEDVPWLCCPFVITWWTYKHMNARYSPMENDNPFPLNSSFNAATNCSRIFSLWKKWWSLKKHG